MGHCQWATNNKGKLAQIDNFADKVSLKNNKLYWIKPKYNLIQMAF